ncbi:hypothetical protein AG1IA_06796 [Rhizoctonia solani AG-1 IA]|uniref:Uncharacterized protein n=1 Tax=Thanatephorus cucumeris (strain AG1-IA) TaxID=983506 RepID=L8WS11_THACA|nr:hypothetical protein AG1IA_06796 [Rhizoctonia solani AG-1 IA]
MLLARCADGRYITICQLQYLSQSQGCTDTSPSLEHNRPTYEQSHQLN